MSRGYDPPLHQTTHIPLVTDGRVVKNISSHSKIRYAWLHFTDTLTVMSFFSSSEIRPYFTTEAQSSEHGVILCSKPGLCFCKSLCFLSLRRTSLKSPWKRSHHQITVHYAYIVATWGQLVRPLYKLIVY